MTHIIKKSENAKLTTNKFDGVFKDWNKEKKLVTLDKIKYPYMKKYYNVFNFIDTNLCWRENVYNHAVASNWYET